MQLKTVDINGKTYAEVSEGRPIFIEDNGNELAVDVPAVRAASTRLGNESKIHREANIALEAKLKAFEGIDDAAAAKKALETLKNIDQGQLIASGKVEEIKIAAQRAADEKVAANTKQFQTELASTQAERDKFKGDLYSEKIGGAFARSKFIAEKASTSYFPEVMQAMFGKQFTIEEGKIVARDIAGNVINSSTKFTEPADFEEALAAIVQQHPNRNQMLKGANSTGSGARQSNGGNGGAKTMSLTDFQRLPPMQQAALMSPANKERPTIVDAA